MEEMGRSRDGQEVEERVVEVGMLDGGEVVGGCSPGPKVDGGQGSWA